jgi:hypothetical protein
MVAATTILGPTGTLKRNELNTPKMTDITPTMLEKRAIISGVLEKFLAAAGGIINSDVISKTPTIFIEIATVKAISNESNN